MQITGQDQESIPVSIHHKKVSIKQTLWSRIPAECKQGLSVPQCDQLAKRLSQGN